MRVDSCVVSLRLVVGNFQIWKNNLCQHFPPCFDRHWGISIIGTDQYYGDKRNILLIFFFEFVIFLIAAVKILHILGYVFGGEEYEWFVWVGWEGAAQADGFIA